MKDIVINKIAISGIVADDYETTGKNANLAEFSVVSMQYVKHGTEWVEEPTVYPVKMFIREEQALMGVRKDAKVIVLGTLKPFWKDEQTFGGYSVWVDSIQFLEAFQTAPMAKASLPSKEAEPVGPEGFDEAEIPF